MIKTELIIDTDVLDALGESLRAMPETMRKTVNKIVLPKVRDRARQTLAQPIPPVRYPLRWKSAKQRRAFFATNGFGHGIPYQRTGRLQTGWRVETTPVDAGLAIELRNDTPYARYVVGNEQQPFHQDTGWYLADEVTLALSDYANNEIIEAWAVVSGFETVLP